MKQLSILILLLSIVSCSNDFVEINTNPNGATDAQPDLLLRKVLWDYTEQMSYEGFVAGNLLGQYFTSIDFNLFDRHSLTESQFGGNPWDIIYPNLRDTEIILTKSRESAAFAVYEGPALVIKSYLAASATDLFGDVPYSEAAQGKSGIISPIYDSQEEIYLGQDGIIANLKLAMTLLTDPVYTQSLSGDIIYNGDLRQWQALAGSLLIKALMRVSDRVDVSADLTEVFESSNYISEASDNAVYQFTAQPNNFRMSTARVGDYNLYIMSETISEIFESYDDPRQQLFFRPTAATGDYVGLLNGPDASQLSISVSDYSLSGEIFRENATALKGNIMTDWETGFLLAEAAEKGYINSDAGLLYADATEAGFQYWGLEMPDNYLTEAAAYTLDPLRQIATQKWINSIVNGYEGWIEYRRTGYPELKTISASLNGDLIPVRMPYPTTEAALNTTHYNTAAEATDDNSVNVSVWWDVN